jgi:hypothetical protein
MNGESVQGFSAESFSGIQHDRRLLIVCGSERNTLARQDLFGLDRLCFWSVAKAAEATFATLIFADRFKKMLAAKIGPEAVGDINF